MQIEKLDKKIRDDVNELHHQNFFLGFNEQETWQKLELSLLKHTKRKRFFFPLSWAAILIVVFLTGIFILRDSFKSETIQNTVVKVNPSNIIKTKTIQPGNSIAAKLFLENNKKVQVIKNYEEKNGNSNLVVSQTIVDYSVNQAKSKLEIKDTITLAELKNKISQEQTIIATLNTLPTSKVQKKKLKIVHLNELGQGDEPILITQNDIRKMEKQQEEIIIDNNNSSLKAWPFFKIKTSNTIPTLTTEN